MMKYIGFLIFIASSQGYLVKREVNIPPASISQITSVDPPGFVVEWYKIPDPKVLGYKLKVWEVQGDDTYHYETIDGEKKLVQTKGTSSIKASSIQTEKPKEIIIQGADNLEAKFENAKVGVLYEIRVLGFTAEGEGPMSSLSGIRIGDSFELEQNLIMNNKSIMD